MSKLLRQEKTIIQTIMKAKSTTSLIFSSVSIVGSLRSDTNPVKSMHIPQKRNLYLHVIESKCRMVDMKSLFIVFSPPRSEKMPQNQSDVE